MTSDDENVIPFPRGQFERSQNRREALYDEQPVLSQPVLSPAPWMRKAPNVEQARCDHRRAGAYVDEEARRVYCRACGVELDPIAVIAWIAHRRENLVATGLSLRHEVDHLAERLERLRKDETNAKARIRKARKTTDDEAALREAAQATMSIDHDRPIAIGGYRSWPELSEPQREVVVGYVRRIVEAYHGALSAIEQRRSA